MHDRISFARKDIYELCEATGIKYSEELLQRVETILAGTADPHALTEEAQLALPKVRRFRGVTMGWEDNVWQHSLRCMRMLHLARHYLESVFPNFPHQESSYVADHHDLPEGMYKFGDVPTNIKRTLPGRLKQLLDTLEERCFDLIAQIPDMRVDGANGDGHIRRRLLFHAYRERQEPWTHIIKYFDLLDALLATIYSLVHQSEACDVGYCEHILEQYQGWMREILVDGTNLPAVKNVSELISSTRWRTELLLPKNGTPNTREIAIFAQSRHLFDHTKMVPKNTALLRYWVTHILLPSRTEFHNPSFAEFGK